MPRDYDSHRPKKSWREIDQSKDSSSHRKDDQPRMSGHKQARADAASKVYKSKLDSAFDGSGKMPAHLAEKFKALEDTSPKGKKRKAAIGTIKEAATSFAKTDAIKAYLEEFELPADYAVLEEVLACSDEDYQSDALDVVLEMLAASRPPKRAAILEQRVKRISLMGEEPAIVEKAKAVIKQLRLFT